MSSEVTRTNRTCRWLERRGPYQSLVILAVPLAVVEPAKLVAVAILGDGQWLAGIVVMLAAYVTSIFFIHRLFVIVKPKLLKLRWFAKGWRWLGRLRAQMLRLFIRGARSAADLGRSRTRRR